MAPTTYGYLLCGQWSGVAPEGATMFVKCAYKLPPARYVIIIGQNSEGLNICEVEVYRALGKFCMFSASSIPEFSEIRVFTF
jgi:hypothetical protein